jgi:two-component system, sensor histidine kinase PdtaS
VSTLRDLVEEHADLGAADIDHLHLLAGDWQLVSDLSFADLVLWVSGQRPGHRLHLCGAGPPDHRPTIYQDDQVGRTVRGGAASHLAVAVEQGRIWREGDPVWFGKTPARQEAVPVRRRSPEGGPTRVIAVWAATPTWRSPGPPASWSSTT